MNRANLLGRLTRDPETRYSNGQQATAVTRFTLAVDRKFKRDGEPTADFINCVAFGKTAEFVEKYFRKGNRMALSGRIQTGSYTNKDGNKVYTTDVVLDDVEFCENRNSGQSQQNQTQSSSVPGLTTNSDGFMDIPDGIDEELPFN